MYNTLNSLDILDRTRSVFDEDLLENEAEISKLIKSSSILVVGGAGSIGMAVTKQLFSFGPKKLHVTDISENNLVELVRDIRSSLGYIEGEFKTFVLDFTSILFDLFLRDKQYDYVFNLAALKHVRSEKDPYTLLNLIKTNIIETVKLHEKLSRMHTRKYFVVSSDKASAPVNLMGASKLLMEHFLRTSKSETPFSSARFANVAFSDGSLLHGFKIRLEKRQPITAPNDIKRYFVNSEEAGRLCLLSGFLGDHRNIFFPNVNSELHLISFSEVAQNFLNKNGLEYLILETEAEARDKCLFLYNKNVVPVYFFKSDTTGEKPYEEFTQKDDCVDLVTYKEVGVILSNSNRGGFEFKEFCDDINSLYQIADLRKTDIVEVFEKHISNFYHIEKNKNLDEKM
ncbi:polysaccharide biosynthesis protein [Planktomarina temperata]|nr:polysaccharide biosynthesis protein [Planktomarina temperata]